MFGAMDAGGTGMSAYRGFLDTVAYNIANINTVHSTDQAAFRGQYVNLQEIGNRDGAGPGEGVRVASIEGGSAVGRLVYSPTSPLADTQGYVRMPDIDLGDQMGNLIVAQRAYQANAMTVTRAKDAYEAAIGIGRGV